MFVTGVGVTTGISGVEGVNIGLTVGVGVAGEIGTLGVAAGTVGVGVGMFDGVGVGVLPDDGIGLRSGY